MCGGGGGVIYVGVGWVEVGGGGGGGGWKGRVGEGVNVIWARAPLGKFFCHTWTIMSPVYAG